MESGIRCPFCGSENNQVICTRSIDGGIRRRRSCLSCRMRWNTFEYPEDAEASIRQQQIRAVQAVTDARMAIRDAIGKLQGIQI